jgi:hypothetical protein
MVNSLGPLSTPTPAVQPWPWEQVILPDFIPPPLELASDESVHRKPAGLVLQGDPMPNQFYGGLNCRRFISTLWQMAKSGRKLRSTSGFGVAT